LAPAPSCAGELTLFILASSPPLGSNRGAFKEARSKQALLTELRLSLAPHVSRSVDGGPHLHKNGRNARKNGEKPPKYANEPPADFRIIFPRSHQGIFFWLYSFR